MQKKELKELEDLKKSEAGTKELYKSMAFKAREMIAPSLYSLRILKAHIELYK